MDQRSVILASLHLLAFGLKLLELEAVGHAEHARLFRILELEPGLLVIFLCPPISQYPTDGRKGEGGRGNLQSSHGTFCARDY